MGYYDCREELLHEEACRTADGAVCLLSTCMLAHADVVNWADIEPHLEELGMEGEFYTLRAVNVMLWVPSDLQPVEELPEDVLERDVTAIFINENGDKGINVVYTDIGSNTLEDYAEALAKEDAENIAMDTINGLNAVEYYLPSNETYSVAFVSDTGKLLEFTMSPFSPEDTNVEWATVIASIQPAVE